MSATGSQGSTGGVREDCKTKERGRKEKPLD